MAANHSGVSHFGTGATSAAVLPFRRGFQQASPRRASVDTLATDVGASPGAEGEVQNCAHDLATDTVVRI